MTILFGEVNEKQCSGTFVTSCLPFIYKHLDVTIGFEKEVYTVHEDASTVSVCAVVSEGELERGVEMVATTQSNSATG